MFDRRRPLPVRLSIAAFAPCVMSLSPYRHPTFGLQSSVWSRRCCRLHPVVAFNSIIISLPHGVPASRSEDLPLCDLIAHGKPSANVLRRLCFVNHGHGIILDRDAAFSIRVPQ